MITTALDLSHQDHPHSQNQEPAIELHDLCKTVGTKRIIDHLSFTVGRGEIVGLLGPNGSGKTTTIKMLNGLRTPTSGTIRILGSQSPRAIRRVRSLIGVVLQDMALYEELSAWTNLNIHADLFRISRHEKKQRIRDMLALVGLEEHAAARVRTFSGGMKRRLALTRALLPRPQLIFLDEPTLGVDVHSRRAIWDYILLQRERGTTVLLTTNYLEEAQLLCDRLAIIDHGTLIALDTPAHLQHQYGGGILDLEMTSPYASTAPLQALSGVQNVIQDSTTHLTIHMQESRTTLPLVLTQVAQEGEIRDMTMREQSLDDIFLRLTGTALRD